MRTKLFQNFFNLLLQAIGRTVIIKNRKIFVS